MDKKRRDAFCEWVDMEIYAAVLTGGSFMLLPLMELSRAETLLIILGLFMMWAEIVSRLQGIARAARKRKRSAKEKQRSDRAA